MINKNSRIFIAGHNGMVGSAIKRLLDHNGYKNLITSPRTELDLTDLSSVNNFFKSNNPEYVIIAAAKVGGINANNIYRAEFIYQNLSIQNNIIHSSFLHNIKKLIFLGSSCIYPKNCKQPIGEEQLLTGRLEITNEPYAIAKIAGIKMCESYFRQYDCNYISLMPTNLYGPNDNYDLESSHVLPALIRKIYEAKVNGKDSVKIWGTGKPLREFLHVDDLANACLHFLKFIDAKLIYNDLNISHLNIGSGQEISIKDLANLIMTTIGTEIELKFDLSKPDGTLRKLLNVARTSNLGWKSKIDLKMGIEQTVNDFILNFKS